MTSMKPYNVLPREVAITFRKEASHKLRPHCQAPLQGFLAAAGYAVGMQSIGGQVQFL